MRALRSTPLAGRYPATVAVVVLALCPYIVVTTAATLLQASLLRDLHTSTSALQMAGGIANAGYAFGAVIAAFLVKKFPPRSLLIACEGLFVLAPTMVASAPDVALFTTGRVLQGWRPGYCSWRPFPR